MTGPRTFSSPAPDGGRFLVNQAVSGESGSTIDVLNWVPKGSFDEGPRVAQ